MSGTLGSGGGTLRANTVSGAIALLRRPPGHDESDDTPEETPAASFRKDV